MTEAVEDAVDAGERMPETNADGKNLEGRLGAESGYFSEPTDDNGADQGNHKSARKSEIGEGQRVSPQNSSLKSRLEKKISDCATRYGVDQTEYLSHVAAQSPVFYSENNKEIEEGKDTINGVLAFLYHPNQQTGEVESLLEQVRPDYDYNKERGKLKLYGGTLKTTDRSSDEGFAREIYEEFDGPAASIIIKALQDNGYKYKRVHYKVDGQLGYTDFLAIKIESPNEWRMVKNAITKHDAGLPRVLTGTVTHELADDYFAFGHSQLIKKLAEQGTVICSPLRRVEFKPFSYNESFVPISHSILKF